jgi:hypothetical protein
MTIDLPQFSLTINMNVLEHLGINLYSNVPAVLSEIVANAWDADASEIHIVWDGEDEIIIRDDGIGMTPQEVNERFLTVGYRRRDQQPGLTLKGRRPMGRKGIGKLSLFSIAGCVEVETARDSTKSAFRMVLADIRQRIENQDGEATYHPEPLDATTIDFTNGTRITLTDLRKRQTINTTKALKRRLARRFSIIGDAEGFRIFVNDQEVTPADRDYYDKIQYLWTYGESADIAVHCRSASKFDRTSALVSTDLELSGWIGTVKEVRHLKDEEGENLNRVAIFVRGKMAQEDILSDFSERGVYASYLIGDIRVDGLDIYDGHESTKDDDAATSSRQRLVEDDHRYVALRKFIGSELKFIQNEWQKLRTEEGADKALEIPAVQEWMDGLQPVTKVKARKWLGKLNRIRIDSIEEQKQLIKHAVLAFEFYRVKENLDALEQFGDNNLQSVLEIFKSLDVLEASLYGQIVKQRIQVIRTLEDKIDANDLEKAIQKYLFDHLWLLDPAWERAEGTEVMERPIRQMFKAVSAELSDEERRGRLDIAYRKSAGQHIIIELKRPERVVSTAELWVQVQKYSNGMQKLLDQQGIGNQPIQIIILLGRDPSDWTSEQAKNQSTNALKELSTRIVFYEQLLHDAHKTYQDYFENRVTVDKLHEIIQAIENYAPPEEGVAVHEQDVYVTAAAVSGVPSRTSRRSAQSH